MIWRYFQQGTYSHEEKSVIHGWILLSAFHIHTEKLPVIRSSGYDNVTFVLTVRGAKRMNAIGIAIAGSEERKSIIKKKLQVKNRKIIFYFGNFGLHIRKDSHSHLLDLGSQEKTLTAPVFLAWSYACLQFLWQWSPHKKRYRKFLPDALHFKEVMVG